MVLVSLMLMIFFFLVSINVNVDDLTLFETCFDSRSNLFEEKADDVD
jgi:hypothetical protein